MHRLVPVSVCNGAAQPHVLQHGIQAGTADAAGFGFARCVELRVWASSAPAGQSGGRQAAVVPAAPGLPHTVTVLADLGAWYPCLCMYEPVRGCWPHYLAAGLHISATTIICSMQLWHPLALVAHHGLCKTSCTPGSCQVQAAV